MNTEQTQSSEFSIKEFEKKPIEERTERELQISQIILQEIQVNYLKSIKKKIHFFFIITIIGLIITALYLMLLILMASY